MSASNPPQYHDAMAGVMLRLQHRTPDRLRKPANHLSAFRIHVGISVVKMASPNLFFANFIRPAYHHTVALHFPSTVRWPLSGSVISHSTLNGQWGQSANRYPSLDRSVVEGAVSRVTATVMTSCMSTVRIYRCPLTAFHDPFCITLDTQKKAPVN